MLLGNIDQRFAIRFFVKFYKDAKEPTQNRGL